MLHKRKVRKICAIVALLLAVTLVFVGCATAKDGDNDVYVEFQDRMSMDWGYEDAIYLEKAVMLKGQGKSVYEKADIIIVTLNRVLNEKYPKDIKSVVEQLAEEEGESLDDIEPDSEANEALRLEMTPADRIDIIQQCNNRLAVLQQFAPKMMDEAEIENVISDVLNDLGLNDPTKREKGKIMKVLMPQVKGKADGKLVNAILERKLR